MSSDRPQDFRPTTVAHLKNAKYVQAGDLGNHRPVVTIDRFAQELVGLEKEERTIVYFRGKKKGMVLNNLNIECLAAMFGGHVPDWYGRSFVLYATDQIAPMPGKKGEEAMCLRIFGSPDIERDVTVNFKMPFRRHPLRIVLKCTRQQRQQQQQQQAAPPVDEPERTPEGDIIPADAGIKQ